MVYPGEKGTITYKLSMCMRFQMIAEHRSSTGLRLYKTWLKKKRQIRRKNMSTVSYQSIIKKRIDKHDKKNLSEYYHDCGNICCKKDILCLHYMVFGNISSK